MRVNISGIHALGPIRILHHHQREGGFTRIELIVIVAVVLLLVFGLIPGLNRLRPEAQAKVCAKNLKDIGIAFRTWCGGPYNYITENSTNFGGTAEFTSAGMTYRHFQGMSNEIGYPNRLICPMDNKKVSAQNFGPGFGDTNVSYFVGLDAKDIYPYTFLAGDRNLAWSNTPLPAGLFALSNATGLAWTPQFHRNRGLILLAGGEARVFDAKDLALAVTNQYCPTNRLLIP